MVRRQTPPVMVSAVVSRHSGTNETMICKQPGPPYAGKWTFPSGPAAEGESPEAAMRRVLEEKLGLQVEIQYGQPPFDEEYEGTLYRWRSFFCEGSQRQVNNKYYSEVRWVPRATLREYEFDPVSEKVAGWLLDVEPG